MAEYGLKGLYVGKYNEDETEERIFFTGGKKIGKAVKLNETFVVSEAKLHADNGLAENVKAITEGTLVYTPTDIDDKNFYPLLGILEREVKLGTKTRKMHVIDGNTEGSFVGVGYIISKINNGKKQYKAVVSTKLKFAPAESNEISTKGDNFTFSTPSITGKMFPDLLGGYHYEEIFDEEEEAEQCLEEIFEIEQGETPETPEE